jgi:hypothetical protein
VLDPETYHDARLVAPSYGLLFGAGMARHVGRQRNAKTRFSAKGICGFLQKALSNETESIEH